MIGNVIYLVYCEYRNGDKILQTPHATFDGTRERMEQIKDHWKGQGMTVSEGIRGNLDVRKPGGEFFRHYYVVTRTILK